MIIKLPPSVRFPITITDFLKELNSDVARLEPLLLYTYKTKVTEYPEYGVEVQVEKTLSSQFDAPVGGKLARWMVGVGSVVENSRFVLNLGKEGGGASVDKLVLVVVVCRLLKLMSRVHMRFSLLGCVQCVVKI